MEINNFSEGGRTQMATVKWSIAFVLTCVGSAMVASSASAEIKTLINGGANVPWTDGASWSPAGAPGLADVARLGVLPATHNSNVLVENNQAVGALEVLNGASLYVNQPGALAIGGNATVSGEGSRLLVQRLAGFGMSANNILVSDGAHFDIANGAEVIVYDTLNIHAQSRMRARGVVECLDNVGVALINDGLIDTSPGFGGLVLNQGGDAPMDLDGNTGYGVLQVDGGNSIFGQDQLTVNGTHLRDNFSGTIEMATASILTMNLSNGWTADANSVINITSRTENSDGIATIEGSHASLGGAVNLVNGFNGLGDPVHFESEATILDTAVFNLDPDNDLLFQSAVAVQGGTFNTHSNLSVDGAVRFNGETTWTGATQINGIALQNGDATVNGITSITAGVFDMDGGGGTTWDIDHFFTVTAESLDSTLSNTFDGVLQLDSPFSNLNVQLTGSFDKWTMNGEMDLAAGLGPLGAERLDGAPVRITGELNSTGRVRIAANAEFAPSAELNFANSDTALMMQAETLVEAGASFDGAGALHNLATGYMRLADGVNMGNIDLVNSGLLEIGNSPGTISVPEFTNTAEGNWLVEIGGHVAGSEYDLLLAGDANLDGLIDVNLIDAGDGLFLPEIGDAFTVLTSLEEILDEFQNDPVSFADGQAFHWQVLYDPHSVTLQLVDITTEVPEPSSIAFALLGLVGLAVVRSSRLRQRGGQRAVKFDGKQQAS